MKPFIVFAYVVIAFLLLAECTAQPTIQAAAPTRTPTALPSPTARPTRTPNPTAPPSTPTAQPLPQAMVHVREFLAKKLNTQARNIRMVSFTEIEWPDSCLGVQTPGIMCSMIVTPGYKVFLQVGDKVYELHSDQSGQEVRLVEDKLQGGNPVIAWQSASQPCQQAVLTAQSVTYGDCQAGPRSDGSYVSADRQADFQYFVKRYASFTARTPSGNVTFSGQGTLKPSPAQQRSIAEWAKLATSEVQAGRSGAAWGLALSFSRHGGIAGFSDDLGVYAAGYALISGRNPPMKKVYLDDNQLKQLYGWLDTFKPVDYSQSSPANTSDAMSVALTLSGTGKKVASDQDIQAMLDFASRLALENR